MTKTYVETFKAQIEIVRERTKAGNFPIDERIAFVEKATEDYLLAHAGAKDSIKYAVEEGEKRGGVPLMLADSKLLERMNYWLLYEDYTDRTPHKSRHSEYPFMSETQLARRMNGKHGRGGESIGETALEGACHIAMDGKDYRVPKRRELSDYELAFRDKNMRIRNAERRKVYREFTKVQPVRCYKSTELVDYTVGN